MLFVVVMVVASAWGFGFGMAIAIWQMASEPCCLDQLRTLHEKVPDSARSSARTEILDWADA